MYVLSAHSIKDIFLIILHTIYIISFNPNKNLCSRYSLCTAISDTGKSKAEEIKELEQLCRSNRTGTGPSFLHALSITPFFFSSTGKHSIIYQDNSVASAITTANRLREYHTFSWSLMGLSTYPARKGKSHFGTAILLFQVGRIRTKK